MSRTIRPVSHFFIFGPLQLGVNVKEGCEAIIHAVFHLMTRPSNHKWTLLLDFTNAFNSIDCHAMFMEIRRRIPSLSAWIECCYSGQPILRFGQETIRSCCGVQQDDPLGPFAFALTLHPIVERIHEQVPNLSLNSWYLDDGTLVSPPYQLAAALDIVETLGPAIGLKMAVHPRGLRKHCVISLCTYSRRNMCLRLGTK